MKTTVISICFLSVIIFCNTVSGDIESDLVAYYDFESVPDTQGSLILDRSGNGHFGICRQDQLTTKKPTIVEGPSGLGDALYFDGNCYVQIANHADFNITDCITISLWFKADQFNTDWQTMFSRGDWSWRLSRNGSTNAASFHMSGFTGENIHGSWGAINVNDGQWHYIVGVWDGSGKPAKMWIDGIRDDAKDDVLTGSIGTNGDDPVAIGAQIDQGVLRRQWKGSIDEVRLYNRALSDSDIEELFSFSYLEPMPVVTLPAGKVLNLGSNGTEFKLDGSVCDDGFPLPSNPSDPNHSDPNKLSWWWEVTVKPMDANEPVLISDNPDDIAGSAFVYNDPNRIIAVDPNVKLLKPGYYEFRLYASDGEKTHYSTMGVHLYPNALTNYRSKGYLYLSPLPGAEYESAGTKYFLVRFVDISPYEIKNLTSFINVNGQKSGSHPGTTKIAADKETVIFTVNSTFSTNELVTVTLSPSCSSAKGSVASYQYQFMTSGVMTAASAPAQEKESSLLRSPTLGISILAASTMDNGVSVPSNFPRINISVNDNPDDSYIFLDNRTSGSNSYNVIFDNYGSPVWYWQTNDERRDMKVQPNGMLTMLQRSPMSFIGLDKNYKQVKTYTAVNGAETDEHELFVREDGYYFLIGLVFNTVNMSKYVSGGSTSASVGQTQIQGFTPEGDLIFQWRGWDHFDVRDVEYIDGNGGSSFRFPHMNAIYFDEDGQLLISSRLLSEVTKIDTHTGEIIWRLGGNHSSFTFPNDPLGRFRNQHSISATTPGRYLLFDNGDLHSPQVSRGVEYELDTNDMTAKVVWQYPGTTTTSIYSHYMGNTQRLSNGNTLINWAVGGLPKLTEVRPDGTKAFEMNWVNNSEAYRVWRCKWDGMSLEPVLQNIEYQALDNLILIFNKFGDPNVSYYKIYAGKESEPNELWTVSNSTLAYVSGFPDSGTYYFRVTAVDMNGTESGYSNEQSASVTVSGSSAALVKNGDFSQGVQNWIWGTDSSASASLEILNGVFHYVISDGGTSWSSVQLRQKGITLIQGGHYIFELDAWADGGRYIEAKVGQEVSPWKNYSGIGYSYIDTSPRHIYYEFDMKDPTDMNSRVVINAGLDDTDVYIDNVSLTYVPPK